MTKTAIITNYHTIGTASIIQDFKTLGWTVYAPEGDWGFKPCLGNAGLGAELISEPEFRLMCNGKNKPVVIIACKPHEAKWLEYINEYGLKYIVSTANRDAAYQAGAKVALISNKQHYDKWLHDDTPKLLYWRRPAMPNDLPPKDIKASYKQRYVVQAIQNLHHHPQYQMALDFQSLWRKAGHNCDLFGAGSPQAEIRHATIIRKRINAYFSLHFKHSDGLGNALLESMLVGTPVVISDNLRHEHPGLMYIEDGVTGFIANSAYDAVDKLCGLSLADYRVMSAKCKALVTYLLDDDARLAELDRILQHVA
jgi:hypothetical protein